jgi:hypothetical protein
MKRFLLLGSAALLVACSENPTQPETVVRPKLPNFTVLTPPGVNLLACFDGMTDPPGIWGGTCAPSADHKKAVLSNNSVNPNGDYSGVYSYDRTVYGQHLTDITELSYTYKSLNSPALAPVAGMLYYQIPIDDLGDGSFDFSAIIDAATCGVKPAATVNIVTMAKCVIEAGGSLGSYANWAEFVAAYPLATVDNSGQRIQIFSRRDALFGVSNTWQISNVKFGKTGLICVDERTSGGTYGGTCSLGDNFKSATLDNTSSHPNGDVSGVYSRETTGYGLFLTNIKDLWYKYSGPVPGPNDLTYGIPIDEDGDGDMEGYALADAAACRGTPNGAGTVWTVNITRDANCVIDYGGNLFGNWVTFAASYPNWRTANDLDNPPLGYMAIIARRLSVEPFATWQILDAKWGAKK